MKVLLSFFLLLLGLQSFSQAAQNPWKTLAMVTVESEYDEMIGLEKIKATPMSIVQKMHGTEIEIGGYIIALTTKTASSHLMFSRYPQNMCFFCGAAGPESAMQVFVKNGDKIDYTSDKVILKGKLTIQNNDPSGLIYTLTDAELVKIIKS